jgi:hypothetical protein
MQVMQRTTIRSHIIIESTSKLLPYNVLAAGRFRST